MSLCDCQLIKMCPRTCAGWSSPHKNNAEWIVVRMSQCFLWYQDSTRIVLDVTVSVSFINPSCVFLEGLHRTTAVESMPNPVVSSSLVMLRQIALTNPVKVHFMISFITKLLVKLFALNIAQMFSPCSYLKSASQFCQSFTCLRYSTKSRWSFSVIWEAEKKNRVGFIPAQFVHALSWSVILSPLRSAPLCQPHWLLQFPFVFFLLCK